LRGPPALPWEVGPRKAGGRGPACAVNRLLCPSTRPGRPSAVLPSRGGSPRAGRMALIGKARADRSTLLIAPRSARRTRVRERPRDQRRCPADICAHHPRAVVPLLLAICIRWRASAATQPGAALLGAKRRAGGLNVRDTTFVDLCRWRSPACGRPDDKLEANPRTHNRRPPSVRKPPRTARGASQGFPGRVAGCSFIVGSFYRIVDWQHAWAIFPAINRSHASTQLAGFLWLTG
jgi:hypothetical protein